MEPVVSTFETSNREQVGLIGLGLMGSAIAGRLIAHGFKVLGFDIDAKRHSSLVEQGGRIGTDPGHLAASCRRIILSLPNSEAVQSVLGELEPHLRYGQVVMDTTTGSPEESLAVANRLARHQVSYVECMVSGNSDQVRRGEVLIMAGGDENVVSGCADVFGCFASKIMYCGTWGSASRMKLVTNLVLGLNRAVLAEGLVFAGKLGLDLEKTLSVLRESMGYSRVMDIKGRKMIAGDFEPQARLSQHLKDVRLILEASAHAGQHLPLSQIHRELLELAEQLGFGAHDNSAVIRAIEAQHQPPGSP